MSYPVDPNWPDVGPHVGGGFRSNEEDTDYGESYDGYTTSRRKVKDTRNTRDIAVEAADTTQKIKDDLTFIKERLHELVKETATEHQNHATLQEKLEEMEGSMVQNEKYNPPIPSQDIFAIDVDDLIQDLGEIFRREKSMIEKNGFVSAKETVDEVAGEVGEVLWKHLRLPSELYDSWLESTDCGERPRKRFRAVK